MRNIDMNCAQVHIMSHIPPGNNDCLSVWSREFAKIIARFEATVAAQFYSHTHNEEFKVFYDTPTAMETFFGNLFGSRTTRAVGVAFIGGSLSPFVNRWIGLNLRKLMLRHLD